jgi:hypothetical protein
MPCYAERTYQRVMSGRPLCSKALRQQRCGPNGMVERCGTGVFVRSAGYLLFLNSKAGDRDRTYDMLFTKQLLYH